jgi:hypothetical protein
MREKHPMQQLGLSLASHISLARLGIQCYCPIDLAQALLVDTAKTQPMMTA